MSELFSGSFNQYFLNRQQRGNTFSSSATASKIQCKME